MTFRVLVVEDEPIAAEAAAEYLRRLAGFAVAGVAHSAAEAVRVLNADPAVDLILLDMNLPDTHGMELLRLVRGTGRACDVIAVTSAREVALIRQAVAQGVVSYLLKPFTFAGFRTKLESYAAYREQLAAGPEVVNQSGIDAMIGLLRPPPGHEELPKGLSPETLERVTTLLRQRPASATEVAEAVGVSRVTARRYLEHLAVVRLAERDSRYGGPGRPEVEYRWAGPESR